MTLKESNPKAYDEFFYYRKQITDFDIENISANSKAIVFWKCKKNSNHIWATAIYRRGNPSVDVGCPFCANKEAGIRNPTLLEVGINESVMRTGTRIHNYWHCSKCKTVWKNKNVFGDEITDQCVNCDAEIEIPLFSETYEYLVDEYSKNNILDVSEINDEYPFDLLWTCKECGQDSSSSIFDKKYYRHKCPYCNHKLPIPTKNSLEALYPELVEEWNWSKNPFKPSEVFPTGNSFASWICKDCKVPFTLKIVERVNGKNCPNCSSSVSIRPEKYQKVVNELVDLEYLDLNLISLDNKVTRYWKCKECEQQWTASFYERFYEKKTCPFCNGNYAIPGKTSFKVLYPELMKEWNYLYNEILEIDPDNIAGNFSINVWWTCSQCNSSYQMSPKRKVTFQIRNKNSCSFCKGIVRNKIHFF